MMEAVEQWEVRTGTPVMDATNSVITVEREVATPGTSPVDTMSMATGPDDALAAEKRA